MKTIIVGLAAVYFVLISVPAQAQTPKPCLLGIQAACVSIDEGGGLGVNVPNPLQTKPPATTAPAPTKTVEPTNSTSIPTVTKTQRPTPVPTRTIIIQEPGQKPTVIPVPNDSEVSVVTLGPTPSTSPTPSQGPKTALPATPRDRELFDQDEPEFGLPVSQLVGIFLIIILVVFLVLAGTNKISYSKGRDKGEIESLEHVKDDIRKST